MPCDEHGIVVERAGLLRVCRRADVSLAAVLDALSNRGETLKESEKSLTKRVGGFVVKSSEGPFVLQLFKHTALRNRYRRGWNAARFLEPHGIPAPRPVAHVEWGIAGIVWRHATITEFLDNCDDVERFYDAHVREGASREELAAYLKRLANAVNKLTATGAIHTDLAGKNILTRDGETFYVIDLDGIVLGEALDESRRLQLHVQLYDSFVNRCDDALLAPLLRSMLPDDFARSDTWLARVKAAQSVRRARTVAAWKREGKR